MASPSTTSTDPDAGFATPAAAAVSLAIALVATAMTTGSVVALKSARSDYARTTAEYALAGAQTRAALDVLQAKAAGRYRWTESNQGEPVQALAESEAQKLSLADAANLDGVTLAKLGVQDADALRTRLAALASSQDLDASDVAVADQSPTWRACAPSLVSPFGGASKLSAMTATTPAPGPLQWRIGEVWRIQTTLASGWSDDRIVRFTGNAHQPTAVIERRFVRGIQRNQTCDAILASI